MLQSASRGGDLEGVSAPGGVSGPGGVWSGGCLLRGVSGPGGGYPSMH